MFLVQFWSNFGRACRGRFAPWWVAYLNTPICLEKNAPAYLNTPVFPEKNGPAYLNTSIFLKQILPEEIARKDCQKRLPERMA